MYFRCPDCLSAAWLDRLEPVRKSEALACTECQGSFEAKPIQDAGASVGEHYRRSLKLSNEKEIDMPTAYSVVLGLLTLEEVRLFQGLGSPEAPAPERKSEGLEGALLLDLDPGFQKAVNDGCLSIQEAIRRGNREAHAAGLAKRHGLTREMAFRVSDNRISLREAVHRKPAAPAPARTKRSITPLQRRAVLGVALLAVVAVAWGTWSKSFEPVRKTAQARQLRTPPPAPKVVQTPVATGVPDRPIPARATEVSTDTMGRITQVVGPDPDSVLAAFCAQAGQLTSRRPIDIMQTRPQSPNARLGVYRDLDSLGVDQAFRIRRDSRTRRWVAGDGKFPIPVRDAPEAPIGELQASSGQPLTP